MDKINKINVVVSRMFKDGRKEQFTIDGVIRNNNLERNEMNEHDTAASLFAIEFAANNFSEFPLRVHINTFE